ncbi:MAG: xylulokinase [Anaerolineae bacterium]
MAEPPFLLRFDVGGSAVKVALCDLCGHVLATQETAIPVDLPRPGWAEIDPLRWCQALQDSVPAVLRAAGAKPEQVAAIGLSNMIGTVVPLAADGRPLRPAITYYDTRAASEAAWMLTQAPDIVQVTGNRVSPGNTSLTSVLWLARHEPQVFASTALFAQTNTFLWRWLTGAWGVDRTNASFMGLLHVHQADWSEALADRLEVDLGRFAPVCASETVEPLTRQTAQALGLPVGIPVALGGLDGAMTSLGVGAIHVGDAFDASGTSEMIACCLDRAVVCPELLGRWHVVPDLWTLIGAISTPGAALQWFRDRFYAGEGGDGQALYARMTQEAAASPSGANGVVFLPHMMGERAPIWDPNARGVFFGLSLGTERGDMVRAVMEGAAYAMRHLIEIIQERSGVPIRRVITVGGAARNAFWRQLKADVWGLELLASPVREAASLGAALTAGVGAGLYADYAEAVRLAVPTGGEVSVPDPNQAAAYDRAYRIYRRLYPALADTMRLAFQNADEDIP